MTEPAGESPGSSSLPTPLERFTREGMLRGVREMLPLSISVIIYGSVFGVLARQVGMSLLETLLMSGLVFAGSAQFAAMGIWTTPLPVASLVLTTLAINLRHLLMGAALRPRFRRFSNRQAFGSLVFMTDENWALAMSKFDRGERDGAYLLGGGIVVYTSWIAAALLGYTAGAVLGEPERLGIDFAATIVFAALLVLLFKGKRSLLPWSVAAAVAIAADRLLPGNWYIILGGIAGCAAGAWRHDR